MDSTGQCLEIFIKATLAWDSCGQMIRYFGKTYDYVNWTDFGSVI